MDPSENAAAMRVQRLLLQHLESLSRAGVGQVPRRSPAVVAPPQLQLAPENAALAEISTRTATPAGSEPIAHKEDATAARKPETSAKKTKSATPKKEDASKPGKAGSAATVKVEPAVVGTPAALLASIRQEVVACRLCRELAETRTQTVFGVGPDQPRLCFMGEAPGADEDAQGIPFVGRAGKLLTDMITLGMGLRREDVYILNVLKCRPPGNRTPSSAEVANCRGYFERQIEVLQPEFICCLGTVAAQALLQTTTPVGKLRGRVHTYRGAKVIVTYHPSYLLRSPDMKKEAWIDLQRLLKEMGLPIPKRQQGSSS
jgi:DNA polymerase